jgi:superfamily II DNA or RNA helicase
VPIFLISLKAGGVGLNLPQADTVIHYDPWWNPAVETQATDRAHRIGQTHTVFVYKLVAQGTIEERILALQERKARWPTACTADRPGASNRCLPKVIWRSCSNRCRFSANTHNGAPYPFSGISPWLDDCSRLNQKCVQDQTSLLWLDD